MKNKMLLIPLFSLLLILNGCFGVNGNFRQMRNYLLDNIDASFKKDTEFAVGPATIALAGFAVSFSDEKDGELASEILDNISKAQIGVYNVRGFSESSLNFSLLKDISKKMERKGWKYIVRSVEDGEMTAVFVPKSLDDGVKRLFVISVNKREMTLVEIYGDLDEVVEIAVRERGLEGEMFN